MINTRKSIRTLLMGLLLFAAVLVTGNSMRTYAENLNDYGPHMSEEVVFLDKDMLKYSYSYGYGFPAGTKISNIKTTNSAVARARAKSWKDGSERGVNFQIDFRKAGKATISFSAQLGSQTTNYKTTFVAKKYVCPVKTFKIGSKEYVSKLKNNSYYNIGKKVSGKVYVKAASGWKIDHIAFDNWKTGKSTVIKNNRKVKLAWETAVYVVLVNKADEYISVALHCVK